MGNHITSVISVVCCLCWLCFFNPSFAAADSSADLTQRVSTLEQHAHYIDQLAVADKIEQLQQSVQDLRGFIEMLGGEIKQLQNQQASLDARLSALSQGDHSAAKNGEQSAQSSAEVPVSKEEESAYKTAVSVFNDKAYIAAAREFDHYLKQYPQGKYVADAHFYLGQIFILSGDFGQATSELRVVSEQYAQSEKAPEALLKLAAIAYEQAQYQQAKNIWQSIIQKYPESTFANTAKTRLSSLNKSGY